MSKQSVKPLLAAVIVALLTGGIAALGSLPVSWPWILAAATLLSFTAWTLTQAVLVEDARSKVRHLWGAVLILFILTGEAAYLAFSNDRYEPVPRVVQGMDPEVYRLHGSPGGESAVLNPYLVGGQTVYVECYVEVDTAGIWFRIDGRWWAQSEVLKPPRGISARLPVHCDELG